ncbi:MAG: ATP-dependent helicase, partial [Anaerolineales bacterium]|nr:ATP-dependent helicase [Anaerolineales bacterium]
MTSFSPAYLTPEQRTVITTSLGSQTFLSGPAGSGKTTVGVERLLYLQERGIPGEQILIMVPQRSLAAPYQAVLRKPGLRAGGIPSLMTIGGLARRMVELFWPLISETAGFANPEQPPTFLTLESAQYYMAHLVRPLFQQGYFETVTLARNRLYSQILDNLNKAAVIGFSHEEIGTRLRSAWIGEPAQGRVYADAQHCASLFRQYCRDHNLLDFSLQVELFWQHLWGHPLCHQYLRHSYRHLVYDNLEEDTPLAADLLRQWLPDFDSALLIYDQDGGYRRFLGADPQATWALSQLCDQVVAFPESLVAEPGVLAFGQAVANQLAAPDAPTQEPEPPPAEPF